MKTWKICVEYGIDAYWYETVQARTLESAIKKVEQKVRKEQRTTGLPRQFMISPAACQEVA